MTFFGMVFFYLNPFAWPLMWFSRWWEKRYHAQIQRQTQKMAQEITRDAYETGFRLGLADGQQGIDVPIMGLASGHMQLGYKHGLTMATQTDPISVEGESVWTSISKPQPVVS
jgi:hypothetical protein